MVVEPWARLRPAIWWNGQPIHHTTGVARMPATHSQPENPRAGTIEMATIGTVSTTEVTSRRVSCASSRSAASSSGSSSATA